MKRKGSAFGRFPDHFSDVQLPKQREIEPVHLSIPLAAFGCKWNTDAVVLYTNSLRSELNDLIFLTRCLQATAVVDPFERRSRHKNVQVDFEIWFTRFSQYAELLLKGFEGHFFPLVTDMLHRRDVMVSRAVAVIEAEGRSYVQAWASQSNLLSEKMEAVRDLLNTVDNHVLLLQRTRFIANDNCSDIYNTLFDSVRNLVPSFVSLLDYLDDRISALIGLGVDGRKLVKRVHRQFANLITREGSPPLGFSGITTLTRWIEERKLRSEHVTVMAKASKQSLFTRYRADNSHHTIIKIHRLVAADGRRRRNLLQ